MSTHIAYYFRFMSIQDSVEILVLGLLTHHGFNN